VGVAGYVKAWLIAALTAPLLAACSDGMEQVAGPFFVGRFEAHGDPWMFRCTDDPPAGCSGDGLPDGKVLRAGGDARHIAMQTPLGYYYFRRLPQERRGWGNNPEVIVGPLSQQQFAAVTRELALPPLDVVP
jgi:hypothetical protein